MYLISLYFDEGTNKKIQLYMEQIAQRTGNLAMIDGKVPPHITLSAFDMAEEEKAIAGFTAMEQQFERTDFLVFGRDVSATYNLFVTGFKCISAKAVRVCFLKDQISGGGTDPEQIPAVFLVPAYNTGKKTEPGGNAGGICCDAEPVCTVYR